jgi:hypothetical protein
VARCQRTQHEPGTFQIVTTVAGSSMQHGRDTTPVQAFARCSRLSLSAEPRLARQRLLIGAWAQARNGADDCDL